MTLVINGLVLITTKQQNVAFNNALLIDDSGWWDISYLIPIQMISIFVALWERECAAQGRAIG